MLNGQSYTDNILGRIFINSFTNVLILTEPYCYISLSCRVASKLNGTYFKASHKSRIIRYLKEAVQEAKTSGNKSEVRDEWRPVFFLCVFFLFFYTVTLHLLNCFEKAQKYRFVYAFPVIHGLLDYEGNWNPSSWSMPWLLMAWLCM